MSRESPDPAKALEKFQRLFHDLCRWLAWKRCADPEGAAAEAIFRALKQPERLAGMSESQLRAFLFGIARNVCREQHRRRSRERQIDPSEWARWVSDAREEEAIFDRMEIKRVRRCLDQQEWQLLDQYALREDHDGLCRELGVTKGALRVRICRIRRKIRACLGKDR